jgi:tetratricopeptide (TPR) repeat protein
MLKMRHIAVVLLVALLGGQAPVHAQTPEAVAATTPDASVLDDTVVRFQAKRGLDLLYDMRFDEARRLFDQIDRRFPEHPIGPFLQALNTWWKILLDLSNTEHDAAFYAAMDEVIARSDRLLAEDSDHFDALFFKGAALGFRGRLRSNRREYLKAATDGKRAMDYVLAVAERAPENHDYVFGKGLYDYYAAVIPDRYPFAKPVMAFFPDGDRERGLRELHRTATRGYYVQTEAVYFLLQIYYLFERNYQKSVEHVTWLRERHPNNAYFHAFEGRVYARWGQWDRAERIFQAVLERYQARRPGYNAGTAEQALYYLARAQMSTDRFDAALGYLIKLEALTARSDDDSYFKVMGRLRQGMTYDALGQRAVARQRYQEVLRMKEWASSHDRAERYLNRPYRG